MRNYKLRDVDAEDIEDFLLEVQTSLGIRFVQNELIYITTFGELCDHIAGKIKLDNVDDCTSQQVFYKLRNGISSTCEVDKQKIVPSLCLDEIFPRESRRLKIKILEKRLGFTLSLTGPPHWVTTTLALIVLTSFFGLFLYWEIALLLLSIAFCATRLANKLGNELQLQTVGQLAKKLTREQYLKSRRDPTTFNKQEIETMLTDWFSEYFSLDKRQMI